MPDTALKIWVGIPDGSRMEVWLESTSSQWGGGGGLVVSHQDGTQTVSEWRHEQLHPGPVAVELKTGKGYTARVRVGFTGDTPVSVTIMARIVKPGGLVFGSEYAYVVSGRRNDVARSTIIAVVKRPGGSS